MKNKVESIVIVGNKYGATATIRFNNPKVDRIMSSNNHFAEWRDWFYGKIEEYVAEVTA